MPPAAVEVRSPGCNPSSLLNTNHDFTAFATNNYSQNQQGLNSSSSSSFSSSNLGSAYEFGLGHHQQGRSRIGSGVPSRTRPRLVKVRKQLHDGRARNACSGKIDSGFNPFQKTGQGSDSVEKGTVNTLLSNGFSFESLSSNTVNIGGVVSNGNMGFAFGANGSERAVNLNSGEKEPGGNELKLGCCDERKVVNESGSESSTKSVNTGFLIGANQSDAGLNLYWEKRDFGDNMEKSTCDDGMKMKTNREAECMKFENSTFVFGANRSSGVEMKLVKGENSECVARLGSCNGEKVKLGTESGLTDSTSFVFGVNEHDFSSNLKKEVFGEQVDKQDAGGTGFPFCDGQNDLSSTSSLEKNESGRVGGNSGLGFVFGASWFNLMSNLNLGESGGNFGKPACHDQEKIELQGETESQEVKAAACDFTTSGYKGFFVFGCSGKKFTSVNECMTSKCADKMKESVENFGYSKGITTILNLNLDSDIASNCKVACKSHGDDMTDASSSDRVSKLPDEMKKLNINGFENVPVSNRGEDSRKACAKPAFVFSSSGTVSGTSNGKSGASYDHASEYPTKTTFESTANISTDKVTDIDNAAIGNSSSKSFTFREVVTDSPYSSQFSEDQVKDEMQQNRAAAAPSFSSFHLSLQPDGRVLEASSIVGVEKSNENISTSTADGSAVSFTEFKTPQWDPSSFKANLLPEVSRKLESSGRNCLPKDKRSKKVKGKLKKSSLYKQHLHQGHVPKESNCQEKPKSPECYTPMDFSPYQESTAADQFSNETFGTSNRSSHLDDNFAPSTLHSGFSLDLKDKDVAYVDKGFGVSEDDLKCREPEAESSGSHGENGDVFGTQKQEINYNVQFCFASGLENEKTFMFSASSSAQGSLSSRKQQLQKKSRSKIRNSPLKATPSQNAKASSSPCRLRFSLVNSEQHQDDKPTSQGKAENKSETGVQVKQGSSSTSMITEACEMWRLRGNQAYRNGNLPQAEDYYTQGINAVPSSENLGCCCKPLVLCYSNRAATRISLGRIREALGDCMEAAAMDPNFLKVYIRAANCHLVLGEVEHALQYFNKYLESGADVCLDRRTTIEAAEGLQKSQKVAKFTNYAIKLLEQKTSDAALSALEIIAEALSISSCSEKLLQMKAEATFLLRRYEEVIELCEQTLLVAEKNFPSVCSFNQLENVDGKPFARLWRWYFISKSYFYMGKLEVGLDLLQKLEQVGTINDKHGSEIQESSMSLAATIRELLRCKNAGNEAVRSRRYTEAIEYYTVALSRNVESRPFAAICFCNRAAAHQALGQIADAIADCSLAMALDGNYMKAVSRRAMLHEMIRDYGQAAIDIQRLIYILENQSVKANSSDTYNGPESTTKELRQARRNLSATEQEAKRGIPLDIYLILGIKNSDNASDIKKAYRKAALKHHPDKAGQFLVRSESRDEGQIWKEIAEEVHKDADRLFKMIGEAYAILSDTTKRTEYDLEEEMRKAKASKERNRSSPSSQQSDVYSYPFEKSGNRRSWRETRRTYGNSQYWW